MFPADHTLRRVARAGLLAVLFALPWAARGQSAVALAEMQTIADAMDACALMTLYYVVPEALDDTSSVNLTSPWQYIADQGGSYVIQPWAGQFLASRRNLVTAANPWTGPYVNYQPGRTQAGGAPYDLGSPLDPWGSPYRLFSPLGLLRGDTGTVSQELYGDQFDRYTLVSLGPDGVMSADDLRFAFGPQVTAFALSSVRAAAAPAAARAGPRFSDFTATAGTAIIVRGLNLGPAQSGARIFWGAVELTAITSWSEREVGVTLPANLTGTDSLVVHRGASTTNGLTLTITPPAPAAAEDWAIYD